MKIFIKKYRGFLGLALVYLVLYFSFPGIGSAAARISFNSFVDMMIIVPPIFVLLGLFDIWVPKETVIKLLGEKSRFTGIALALFLGSFSAGPLYAAFPVVGVLINKGCKYTNILIFTGAWATTKVPMLLFEAGSMGWRFMITRLLINIPGILIMAYCVEMLTSQKEKAFIYGRESPRQM